MPCTDAVLVPGKGLQSSGRLLLQPFPFRGLDVCAHRCRFVVVDVLPEAMKAADAAAYASADAPAPDAEPFSFPPSVSSPTAVLRLNSMGSAVHCAQPPALNTRRRFAWSIAVSLAWR